MRAFQVVVVEVVVFVVACNTKALEDAALKAEGRKREELFPQKNVLPHEPSQTVRDRQRGE